MTAATTDRAVRAETPVGALLSLGRGPLLGLFVLSVIVRFATAQTIDHAGYFDAFYYFGAAESLAGGDGLTDSVIWNYLDDPADLPRPALQYWMPLPTLLAWFGITIAEPLLGTWHAAQLPFVVLASLLPPLAAALSWSAWRRKGWAIAAGLLTLAAPLYIVAWVNTDSVTPYAVSVSLTLIALQQALATSAGRAWFVAGLGAGLSHLSRIDGALLVPIIAGYAVAQHRRDELGDDTGLVRHVTRVGLIAGAGYLLVLVPWWIRNIVVVGTPVPGSGYKTVLFRQYQDLFSFDADVTLERYLDWGIGPILWSKLASLVETWAIAAVVTSFVLVPVLLVLPRVFRTTTTFRCFGVYAAVLLIFLPLVATFPATHGVTLHSAASMTPWLMACVPFAVDRMIHRFGEWRNLEMVAPASRTFVALVTVGVMVFATHQLFNRILAHEPGTDQLGWNETAVVYEQIATHIENNGAPTDRVLAIDPPKMFGLTGYEALAAPWDGPGAAARVAETYDAQWLVLDQRFEDYFPTMYPSGANEAGWEKAAEFEESTGEIIILFAYSRG